MKKNTNSSIVGGEDLFKVYLSQFISKFDPYTKAFYRKKLSDTREYSPVVSTMYKNLADFSNGGKKLRAFFVYLGYLIGGGREVDKILPISLAFEMTQNFFLIHDDIIDNSDLRRGRPTIHKVYEQKFGEHYGQGMAIVLGDIAVIEAFNIICDSDFSEEQKVECLAEFARVMLKTGYGQSMDLEYSFEVASISEIFKIADLKTARYSVVGPLLIGAKLAKVNEDQEKAIIAYGLNVGLAFQLQDDMLGIFGDEKTTGKSILSDMREGKNTVLIYKAKEMASQADQKRLDRVWGKKDATYNDLKIVRQIVEGSGALKWSQSENMRLVLQAKEKVEKITEELSLQAVLSQIADFVVNRAS